jgi:hypothetical protein
MNYFGFEDESERREVEQQLRIFHKDDKLFQAKDHMMTEVINQNNMQLPVIRRENSEQRKTRDEIFRKVVMMGYDLDVVEYAALKVEACTVEAIIEYLSKGEDGLYHHDFKHYQGDLCYLCKEDRQ